MYTDKPVHSRRVLRYRYVCYVVCTEKQVHIIYTTSVFSNFELVLVSRNPPDSSKEICYGDLVTEIL